MCKTDGKWFRAARGMLALAVYLLIHLVFKRLPNRFVWDETGAVLSPSWLNAFSCGVCFLIALYSLSLYVGKRGENYLLWLSFMAFFSFLRTLFNSSEIAALLPGGLAVVLQTPLDIFLAVICAELCFWMTGLRLPGRWNFLLRPGGLLLLYAFLLFMRYRMPGSYLQRVAGLFPYAAGIVCLTLACAEDRPGAWMLLVGMTVRFELRGCMLAAPADSHVYACISAMQLDFLTFVLICMFVINRRFAGKFSESERLGKQLRQMNSSLDQLVEKRTAEWKRANEVIVRQQKARQNLMTNIFHDLRSPLFVLQGYIEMLGARDEREKKQKEVLRDRVHFIGRLVEDLFLTAKLEDGKIGFFPENVPVDEICRAVLQVCADSAREKELSIRTEAEKCAARADPFRLRQALENLVNNAIQYTPQGGEIRLCCRALEDGRARIGIWNSGCWISETDLPHIFERYYHGTHDERSTGLGLSIASSLLRGMGGALEASSGQETGTEFIIFLPAVLNAREDCAGEEE